ncbi:hypothetical protein J6590_059093 [Homalodisca vitripennis]|nr:hypothetical protein J6590_059093 [Homalodisca vitripennis]
MYLLLFADNPSYFTVPGGSKFSLLKRRGLGGSSGTCSPPLSPTSAFPPRRHSRTLLRSVSAQSDASLLVLGNPRLCDLAPTHRPSASASASDLQPDDDGEVFLYPDGDARYYNLTAASRREVGGRRRHSFGEFIRTTSSPTTPQAPEPKKCHSSRKRCDKCSEKAGIGLRPVSAEPLLLTLASGSWPALFLLRVLINAPLSLLATARTLISRHRGSG